MELPYKRVQDRNHARRAEPDQPVRSEQRRAAVLRSVNEILQPSTIPANPTATSPVTGYNITTLVSPTFTRFNRDDLRSRWQIQLGARLRF